MGKGGRPRKNGERYPSGKLKQVEGMAPALWGRIKANAAKFFGDPRFGSELGCLSASGELTNAQVATGYRIGDIYRRWHRLKRLRDNPKSPSYEQGFGGSSDLAEERMSAEQLEAFEASIRAAETAWRSVDAELSQLPRNIRQAILDLCVYETAVNSMLLRDIGRALDHVALRWGPDWGRQGKGGPRPSLAVVAAKSELPRIAPRRPRVDHSLAALQALAHTLRPDLDGAGLAKVSEVFIALRDREQFRQTKTAPLP